MSNTAMGCMVLQPASLAVFQPCAHPGASGCFSKHCMVPIFLDDATLEDQRCCQASPCLLAPDVVPVKPLGGTAVCRAKIMTRHDIPRNLERKHRNAINHNAGNTGNVQLQLLRDLQ
jgi:hypothetical protein